MLPYLPYFLTIDESSGDSLLTLSANATTRVSLSNDDLARMVIESFGCKATSKEFLLEIDDPGRGRRLCNAGIHAQTIFGGAGRFFMLPKPHEINKSSTIFLIPTDLSGAENQIRFFLQGKKIIGEKEKPKEKEYSFFYTTDSTITLSSGAEGAEYITFSYGNFVLSQILAYSDGAFKFRISDTNNGLRWSNGWIHSDALGSAEYNRIFDKIPIAKNTKLKIEVVDLSSAENRIFFTLAGLNQE